MSPHATIKAHTAGDHAIVDAAFSTFDLADHASYVNFLQIHAIVLPAIELVLKGEPTLPQWRPRTDALAYDLAAFGYSLPEPLPIGTGLTPAEKFGLLYVVEGSRLGNRLLQHRVGLGFSSRYLAAIHYPGEWRVLMEALDERGSIGSIWIEEACSGARLGFHLYTTAVESSRCRLGSETPH